MDFCPVCGVLGAAIVPQCERIARYYGYSADELARLQAARRSIAVPFFEIKRFFFLLESLGRHPMRLAMLAAVEKAQASRRADESPQEFGNSVWIVPFSDPSLPGCSELYLKEDVSKTMVIYQQEGAIEHIGSEERALIFTEMAERFFGLGEHVPPVACGLSSAGNRFVVSAGLPRDRYVSLENRPRKDLAELWRSGLLSRLALLDFVLGQDDRSSQNVLFTDDPSPRVGLIDNDNSFVTHERLAGEFAYLVGLDDGLDLGVARDWFAQFELARLIAQLSSLSLPEAIMLPLCRRFAFAKQAVATGMPLRDFKRAIFIELPPSTWQLAHDPWPAYLPLVKEGKGGTLFRTILTEPLGSGFAVDMVEGKLLDPAVTCRRMAVAASAQDAEEEVLRLWLSARGDGFVRLMRRRLFVRADERGTDDLRIVEIRADPSGFHVVVKRGKLGHYETRQIERGISFDNQSLALASADSLESELLADNYSDLRARLSSFRAAGPATLF